jgi:hypothetical protein
MAWASARCKSQARRSTARRSSAQRASVQPVAPQLIGGGFGSLTTTTQHTASGCLVGCAHHQRRSARHRSALPRRSAHRNAPQLTEAPVTGGHPHHLLQAHEPSGCNPHRPAGAAHCSSALCFATHRGPFGAPPTTHTASRRRALLRVAAHIAGGLSDEAPTISPLRP